MPPVIRRAALILVVVVVLATASFKAWSAEEVLLGRVRPPALPSISESWQKEYDAYEPSAEDLRALATLKGPAVLDVYFGSWCSDSRRELPHLMKILDRASPPGLRVRFYGLDRSKKKPARLARRGAIERVPTLVLSAGGREIGRIVESPRSTLEHDLALLVAGLP
jgi:thioredoxin 1